MTLLQRFRRDNRDLFGDRVTPRQNADQASSDLADQLRGLSERAVVQGLERASCLIEMAAMIVELENAYSRDPAGVSYVEAESLKPKSDQGG